MVVDIWQYYSAIIFFSNFFWFKCCLQLFSVPKVAKFYNPLIGLDHRWALLPMSPWKFLVKWGRWSIISSESISYLSIWRTTFLFPDFLIKWHISLTALHFVKIWHVHIIYKYVRMFRICIFLHCCYYNFLMIQHANLTDDYRDISFHMWSLKISTNFSSSVN